MSNKIEKTINANELPENLKLKVNKLKSLILSYKVTIEFIEEVTGISSSEVNERAENLINSVYCMDAPTKDSLRIFADMQRCQFNVAVDTKDLKNSEAYLVAESSQYYNIFGSIVRLTSRDNLAIVEA